MSLPSLMMLNGEARASLGVVRSLGGKGIPLFVGGNERWAMAGYSRYAQKRFTYPPVGEDLGGAHAAVLAKIREWRPDVLLPVSDEGWELVYGRLGEYREMTRLVPCPGPALFRASFDKGSMCGMAERHGVPIPRTFQPKCRNEALGLAGSLPYPVLLKPREGRAGEGIRRVENGAELETALEAAAEDELPLIQEFIRGQDLELTLLTQEGELLAASAYAAVRNHPLPYGPPVACRTIRDAELVEQGARLLKGLRYTGVAHLDFRRDETDGRPKLLDFNARLAGTDEISARSGIDFSYLLYRLAIDEDVPPSMEHCVGLEFRWLLFGELLHLAQTPRKLQALGRLLRFRDAATNISLRDPLPHAAQLISGFLRRAG